MPTLREIIKALFDLAPVELASEGDNVGLQVGDPDTRIDRVLVALDVTAGLIHKARDQDIQLAVVHHPLIYSPVRSITPDSHPAKLAIEAIRANLAIVTMHTNLDYAPGGVNDRLAETVGLKEIRPLRPWGKHSLVKVVVFVPEENQTKVRRAMCDAGAGEIGAYRECSFRTGGAGTFRPLEGANPAIGKVGKLEEAAEERLELLVGKSRLPMVLQAMIAAHPYEEPAYDIYPLDNYFPGAGQGRIGKLPQSISLKALAAQIGRLLNTELIRTTGKSNKKIMTVAVCSGSARGFVETARQAGADALLAGEIPHHERLEAEDEGLGVIEAGHGPSEKPAVWVLDKWLKKAFGSKLKVMKYEPDGSTK